MLRSVNESQSVRLSVRLYQALVFAYPAEFRCEYGESMVQAFRDSCRRANREGGAWSLLALWGRTTIDYFITVLEENSNGGIQMTGEKFTKLSGWAMILGSLLMLVGFLAASRPEFSSYNAASLPLDRYANIAGLPLVGVGLAMVSLGMAGMWVRYRRPAGSLGSIALGIGVFSGLVSLLGVIGLAVNDSSPWWEMFFLGWTFQFLALALFGLVCLRRKLLRRWNALPLLAGIWLPVMVSLNIGLRWQAPEVVVTLIIALGLAGLAALGYLLQTDARPGLGAPAD
jgi:hypothetical protein